MDELGPPTAFVGDLHDPWVEAIAVALPSSSTRVHCPSDLPDVWPHSIRSAAVVVLHRAIFTAADLERVRRLKATDDDACKPSLRIVLCHGPHMRYAELQRYATVCDVLIPEATASDVVGRQVQGSYGQSAAAPGAKVAVVSSLRDLRLVFCEAVAAAGYTAQPARDWDEVGSTELVVWDIPVLEDGWEKTLARASRQRKVIALLGFPDRETVALARSCGASACLDSPCDPADLDWILDRVVATSVSIHDPAHAVPPPPAGLSRRAATGAANGRRLADPAVER
jgi:hypothetical protein